VGNHKGGYDPFAFDITDKLNGSTTHELVVQVHDPTMGGQPHGKQVNNPAGIWYTPSSGIWQTVWYEAVAPAHIESLEITPDVDGGKVKIKVNAGEATDLTATVTVYDGTTPVVTDAPIAAGTETAIAIANAKLWSPTNPFLYTMTVTLKEGGVEKDVVNSYFGMRKIERKTLRSRPYMFLNDQPVFHLGTLDQGFWPDGLYTAPTYEALRFDVEKTKELGFNMIRKHIKTEPARWYYYCDSIGLMVWQDMPNPVEADGESTGLTTDALKKANALREFENVVNALKNYPSIVLWVAYNEGWGQFSADAEHTRNGVEQIYRLDATRMVSNTSGWDDVGHTGDTKLGDIIDTHAYGGEALRTDGQRAAVFGEAGGGGVLIKAHNWADARVYGSNYTTGEAFAQRLIDLRDIKFSFTHSGFAGGCNGLVYTQITDVEGECNGFFTYDRKVNKLASVPGVQALDGSGVAVNWDGTAAMEAWQSLVSKLKDSAALQRTYVLPTANTEGYNEMWDYKMGAAGFTEAAGWNTDECFSETGWQTGKGGFGRDAGTIGTTWSTNKILLRKMVTIPNLTDEQKAKLTLAIFHDENFELYINGVLAASATGYITGYNDFDISAAAKAAIKWGECNLIAIKCVQTSGGQYIDAGLAFPLGAAIGLTDPVPDSENVPQATSCPDRDCPFGLLTLAVGNYALTPAFDPNVLSYTVNVPASVGVVVISATAAAEGTVEGAGIKPVSVGANVFTITLTMSDGRTKAYTITVTREASAPTGIIDASLEDDGLIAYRSGNALVVSVSTPSEVWIYDLLGTLVKRLDVENSASVVLPDGVYIVKSVSNGKERAVKALNYK
jgi:hypothetical protein